MRDAKFLGLLAGISNGAPAYYPLGIMIAFLKHQADAENYPKYRIAASMLESALEVFLSRNRGQMAQQILKRLQTGEPQLLVYGSKDHSMGLQIQSIDNSFYHFDLLNSGDGLQHYHAFQWLDGFPVYQTRLRIKVPKEFVGINLITYILWCSNFASIDTAYDVIYSLPGSQVITPTVDGAIWQAKQGTDTCTLKWIFVYLKHHLLPEDYRRLCRSLLKDTLLASKEQSKIIHHEIENLWRSFGGTVDIESFDR